LMRSMLRAMWPSLTTSYARAAASVLRSARPTACTLRAKKRPKGKEVAPEPAAGLAEYQGVWIYIEQSDGQVHPVSWELLGKGRELADALDCELAAMVLGEDVDDVAVATGYYGADKAYIIDNPLLAHYRTHPFAEGCLHLIQEYKPAIVLIGATTLGRDLSGAIATDLHTGLTADCTGLEIDPASGLLRHHGDDPVPRAPSADVYGAPASDGGAGAG